MSSKYSEFLDDANPLMERFRNIAPASHKHCQNVASMCMTIASALPQMDKELLHVSALFHDVGKLMAPQYYTENQIGDSDLHADLPPRVSYEIITRHVSDSAALLAVYGFSHEVIRTVVQHHGTSVVRYFQQKDASDEENFRYKWSVPDTIESAVLMIADVVEATAKSYFANGKLSDDHEVFVEEILDRLVEDGQLDVLTYGVARVIKKQLPRELESLYHKRIDYEEVKNGKKNGKVG